MTREELDTLWFKSMREAGDDFTRYRFAALVATTEKQKVVEYMNSRAFATGHGDTIEDLLKEMEWQVAEREREACAKLCDGWTHADGDRCAAAIRARGSK